MSIECIENGQAIPTTQDIVDGWSAEGYSEMVTVRECAACGDKLDGYFVYWSGAIEIGLHVDCARHMSLGLLVDVARLTGTLAHEGQVPKVVNR